ncbi:hypothetical protein LX36DRAFT_319010 [Colletotrichum falcatum]|nr:hypothetical protein LX36DRAFT_319010 [Colletotrichum falcatum]
MSSRRRSRCRLVVHFHQISSASPRGGGDHHIAKASFSLSHRNCLGEAGPAADKTRSHRRHVTTRNKQARLVKGWAFAMTSSNIKKTTAFAPSFAQQDTYRIGHRRRESTLEFLTRAVKRNLGRLPSAWSWKAQKIPFVPECLMAYWGHVVGRCPFVLPSKPDAPPPRKKKDRETICEFLVNHREIEMAFGDRHTHIPALLKRVTENQTNLVPMSFSNSSTPFVRK